MAFLDALLGNILNRGVQLPIPKGLNFASGITAQKNESTGYVDLTLTDGGVDVAALSPAVDGQAPTWTVTTAIAATGAGGTLRDITVYTTPPLAAGLRVKRADLRLSTGHASDAALRTATGGSGSVVLSDASSTSRTFDATSTGRRSDNAAAEHDYTSGALVLRIDRSCVGTLTLYCEAM